MEKMSTVQAIKAYFENPKGHPHSREVSMTELKELKMETRRELGAMCAEALGVELN